MFFALSALGGCKEEPVKAGSIRYVFEFEKPLSEEGFSTLVGYVDEKFPGDLNEDKISYQVTNPIFQKKQKVSFFRKDPKLSEAEYDKIFGDALEELEDMGVEIPFKVSVKKPQ